MPERTISTDDTGADMRNTAKTNVCKNVRRAWRDDWVATCYAGDDFLDGPHINPVCVSEIFTASSNTLQISLQWVLRGCERARKYRHRQAVVGIETKPSHCCVILDFDSMISWFLICCIINHEFARPVREFHECMRDWADAHYLCSISPSRSVRHQWCF